MEILQSAFSQRESRPGAIFAGVFLSIGVVSFVVSEASAALVLQLNSFQLVYRALCTLAQSMSRRPVPQSRGSSFCRYPFGRSRLDIVLQFSAATMLIFASLSVMVEGVHHLLEAHDTQPVLVEAVCFTHLLSIILYTVLCKPAAQAEVIRDSGKWFFVLFECRAPLICLTSCTLVTAFEAPRIDVVCALLFAASCLVAGANHARFLAPSLLLEAPEPDASTSDALRQVALVKGVIRIRQMQLWLVRPDMAVASLKIVIDHTSDSSEVRKRVKLLMQRIVTQVTVELERGAAVCDARGSDEENSAFPAPPIQLRYAV